MFNFTIKEIQMKQWNILDWHRSNVWWYQSWEAVGNRFFQSNAGGKENWYSFFGGQPRDIKNAHTLWPSNSIFKNWSSRKMFSDVQKYIDTYLRTFTEILYLLKLPGSQNLLFKKWHFYWIVFWLEVLKCIVKIQITQLC